MAEIEVAENSSAVGACPTCHPSSLAPPSFIYALGAIAIRIPSLSIEKELAQSIGRIDAAGMTDRQALAATIARPENRFLARKLCWVLTVEGLEAYILMPRDDTDLNLLIGSIRENPSPSDIDVVIGRRGPLAPPTLCNGLQLPIVAIDQIYSFDKQTLIASIPKPEKATAKEFSASAQEMLERFLQLADNAGATDEHRALNYLSVRYAGIYATMAEQHARNSSLQSVDVLASRSSETRRLMDVVFTFANRSTEFKERLFTRVDVTEQFPFLVTKLSPYYDHP